MNRASRFGNVGRDLRHPSPYPAINYRIRCQNCTLGSVLPNLSCIFRTSAYIHVHTTPTSPASYAFPSVQIILTMSAEKVSTKPLVELLESTYSSLKSIPDFNAAPRLLSPKVGIVCGSGLNTLVQSLRSVVYVPYEKLEGFGKSTGL